MINKWWFSIDRVILFLIIVTLAIGNIFTALASPVVANRIGIVHTKTPEKTEFALMDVIPKHRWSHSHHVLIFHGRRMCKARKPECELCPIKDDCDFYQGKE